MKPTRPTPRSSLAKTARSTGPRRAGRDRPPHPRDEPVARRAHLPADAAWAAAAQGLLLHPAPPHQRSARRSPARRQARPARRRGRGRGAAARHATRRQTAHERRRVSARTSRRCGYATGVSFSFFISFSFLAMTLVSEGVPEVIRRAALIQKKRCHPERSAAWCVVGISGGVRAARSRRTSRFLCRRACRREKVRGPSTAHRTDTPHLRLSPFAHRAVLRSG